MGAVALKNGVYVLPNSDETREDFQWIAREVMADGGEASISAAQFLHGLDDGAIRALFREARDAFYAELLETVREVVASVRMNGDSGGARREYHRLRRKLNDMDALDFFQAPLRNEVETALLTLRNLLENTDATAPTTQEAMIHEFRNRTWATRAGVHTDRIASAWLIKRFIDPEARFRFVMESESPPPGNDVRFDMFQADFTHEGDACTFEVLLRRMGLRDEALNTIGEIVHDIDLKDGKFGRLETAGLACIMAGIATANDRDETRLERGAALLDSLYSSLAGQPPPA
ncbi:MAG: chromate resistance protein [Deltaproteobacteria bacterium]|nr:chromate resistance protein [Deltaproteobacteria bacterium]